MRSVTSTLPPLGERIREARLRGGMSLRALARTVGVSASLISQIETGKSQPSVSTLYAITKALGISVEDVFDAEPAVAPRAAATAVLHRLGPIVRPETREILRLDSGVTWERLGHPPGGQVDFLLVTYAPGGSSSSGDALMRHAGVEYGFLVEGQLTLTLGFEEHRLGPGDAVSFASSTPHRYRNNGIIPAVGVWFVSETPP
ncbi:helix-turn-helix domain-containing protein [Actinomycetes bacterium KLBMP 9797]